MATTSSDGCLPISAIRRAKIDDSLVHVDHVGGSDVTNAKRVVGSPIDEASNQVSPKACRAVVEFRLRVKPMRCSALVI